MAERRALIEGLDTIDESERDRAEEFVYNRKPHRPTRITATATTIPQAADDQPAAPPAAAPIASPVVAPTPSSPLTGVGRVPVGARIRTELAAALKRASLERQLQGIQPNSVQDILEESLELWLHKHGLLK